MLEVPGYKLLRPFQTTNSTLLFHAVREADQLPVIVKTPRAEYPGPRERARYQREYNLLQRLQGIPGVLAARGFELLKERPVLLLEDVGGRALSEQLGQPFEAARFLSIAIPLTATLAEVHRRGVIHKDIKPSNILLSARDQVWLIDFGLATLQQVEQVEPASVSFFEGTLPYMSPEQSGRMNRPLDYRTDFYSLGVTLYQVLTGHLPFRGNDALEWLHAHISQAPVPPDRVLASIPPMLSAVVLKLLAKAAEARYQSGEGLKADLERCQQALRQGSQEDFPLGLQDFPTRFQPPQRLYGREAEVEALLQAFARVARERRPEWVMVRGYSGIGKSSVIHELHKPVLQRRGFFLSGKFNQLQRDAPYATLAQAMRSLVQQVLAGSDEEVKAWRQRLLDAFEGNGQVLVELVPQLEQVVGKQPPVPELPPAETQNRFNRLFQRFLGAVASSERLLVLFLDDLQWTDAASLKLLQYLSSHPDTPSVLLIGAYRDNEVDAAHPLSRMLEEIPKAGVRLTDICLKPLSPTQIQRLVGDALPGAGQELVEPLSELLQEKTAGNPFFLLQLLQTLCKDGVVARALEGNWRWDAEAARTLGYSDNVVAFMAGRLRQLPAQTQQLLRLAACVGNVFTLEMLALISHQEASQVEADLDPAFQEGQLVQTGFQHYRFLHDRIQQAAYAQVSEEERRAIHLGIGRLLWARLSPEELHESLFDVVGQLNAGADLMEDAQERSRLARLNAEAGFRAKASVAHRSALGYFTMALSLLPPDAWRSAPEWVFKLRLGQASSELLCGDLSEARRNIEELLPRAPTRQDMASAYQLKSSILITGMQSEAAIACLLEALEQFGVSIPAAPTQAEVVAAHQEVESLLGERPIESLIDLPFMTSPDMKTAMSLLGSLFAPAIFTNEKLLALHICRMVALSLRHGNTTESASAYVWYGFVVSTLFKDHQKGYAFAKVACEFVERYDISLYRARTLYTMGHVSLWVRPLAESRKLYRDAVHQATLTGDFQIASYSCLFLAMLQVQMGFDLAESYQELVALHDFARRTGSIREPREIVQFYIGFVQQMRGLNPSFNSLNMKDFDEGEFEQRLSGRMSSFIESYVVLKTRSRFMCGAYEEARQEADKAKALLWSVIGRPQLIDYHLYRALTLAACYPGGSAQQQEEYLSEIRQHQQQLAEWARNSPETFSTLERMVSAELARLQGRAEAAISAYDEAVQAAREHGFIQNVALASELAARFWKEQKLPFIAAAYARQAREAYVQWGAEGKVRQLDEQWHLLVGVGAGDQSSASYDSGSRHLDALSLVKALQTISSEISLETLVPALIRVTLESAGAQRGALLLLQGDALKVEALVDTSQGEAGAGPPLAAPQELPSTMLAYVRRTCEHVLIADTSTPHLFSSDPFFSSSQARSVLCLPLMRKEDFYGLLYLENSLTTDAFNPGRIALLQHLASQAAISLEIARLYADVRQAEAALRRANEELEIRVEERTRELRQAQAQLIETARGVGMAEIASNVLHDVGHTLTSIVADTEHMSLVVEDSRVGGVEKVADLLLEQRPRISEFFTSDPRAEKLFSYLPKLAHELAQERSALRQGLRAMTLNVDRVRSIVQQQRIYARSTLLLEECDLAEVVAEALRLQAGALKQERVQVTKELAPLPRVKVDRHRLLRILLNLLTNARQALAVVPLEQRHVWLRLMADAQWIRLQVQDNGHGIAPELKERLFRQGFTTRQGSYGIGLHSSALAAKLMGGQLFLESEGPGKGATATLELPNSGTASALHSD